MELAIGYFLLSILGIIKRRSKLLTYLMLTVMWIVFGFCTYNGDFGNYSWIYHNVQNPAYWTEFEPLYTAFMYVCSLFGMNFVQFRMVFGAAFILLLNYTIGQYTENKAEVLGLYMLFPYLYFTSVVRSGFAGILVALAYHRLFSGKGKKGRYWILMGIAVLFHYTSIFFIVYYFFRAKKIKRITLIIIFVLLISVFVLYYSGIMYNLLSRITSSERILNWYKTGGSSAQKPRWVLYLIVIDAMVVFLAYLSKWDSRAIAQNSFHSNPYATEIYSLSIAMLIFIPTFLLSNNSARLMWQMLLLVIISYAKDDECRYEHNSLLSFHLNKNLILIALLMFFFYYSNLPYRGTINDGFMVFQNNLIYTTYSGW